MEFNMKRIFDPKIENTRRQFCGCFFYGSDHGDGFEFLIQQIEMI